MTPNTSSRTAAGVVTYTRFAAIVVMRVIGLKWIANGAVFVASNTEFFRWTIEYPTAPWRSRLGFATESMLPGLGLILVGAVLLILSRRLSTWIVPDLLACGRCGYPMGWLARSSPGARCPECGEAYAGAAVGGQQETTHEERAGEDARTRH